jgi:hypothetical protein
METQNGAVDPAKAGEHDREQGAAAAVVEVIEVVQVTNGEGQEILEIVVIEDYVREGRPVPRSRKYKYRVNKKEFVSDSEEITREQVLERAGFTPVGDFRLRLKRRHGPPEEIKPGTVLHLRLHGIERFIAQAKHVQDGRGTRREFALGEEDRAFLDSLGLAWETLKVPNPVPGQPPRLWVVTYDLPVPDGFNVGKAHVAIEIAPGYPSAQLDMAYFNPPLALPGGRQMACVQSVEKLDGDNWQRWSRHRIGASAWRAGEDSLETQFAFMQDWLLRELGK